MLEKVYFYEVGVVDLIVDIVGLVVGLVEFGVDCIECFLVLIGYGKIKIVYGEVSIFVLVIVEFLKGVLFVFLDVFYELMIFIGVVILVVMVLRFGFFGFISIEEIGFGVGDCEFE